MRISSLIQLVVTGLAAWGLMVAPVQAMMLKYDLMSAEDAERLQARLEEQGILIPRNQVKCFFDELFNRLVIDVYLGDRTPNDVRINSGSMLWYAVEAGLPQSVKFLALRGGDTKEFRNGENMGYRAARGGNREVFEYVFDPGDARCQSAWKGVSGMLKRAAEGGNKDIFDIIFELGAWQLSAALNSDSVIDNAGLSGKREMIKHLQEKGWKLRPNEILLCAAASGELELIRLMEEQGGSVHSVGAAHYTPLMTAALSGNVSCINYILNKTPDKEAAVRQQSSTGDTALICAAASGNAGAIAAIMAHNPDANAGSNVTGSALEAAAASGSAEAVGALMSGGAGSAENVLRAACVAARFGNAELVQSIGANPNAVCQMRIQHSRPFMDVMGTTGITEVETTTPFLAAIASGNKKLVQSMMNGGADVTQSVGEEGNQLTPLRAAARRGQPDIIQMLINSGMCCDKDPVALNQAAENGNLACVQVLLANGWNVNGVDPETGLTAIQAACIRGTEAPGSENWNYDTGSEVQHEDIIKLLLNSGASLSNEAAHMALGLALHNEVPLFNCASVIEQCGGALSPDEMRYPLHRAAQMGEPEWVQKLLPGLKSQTEGDDRNSPLYEVCNIRDSYVPMKGCPHKHLRCYEILSGADAKLSRENRDYLYRTGVNSKFQSEAKKYY